MAQQYGTIGGSLPFGGGGGAFPSSSYGGLYTGDIASAYTSAYNAALQMNQANYSNILAGYQQVLANQQAAQAPIQAGYSNLSTQVLGDISGIGQSQSQAIRDSYAKQSGAAAQDMINRGLGNTTIQNSVQAGLLSDKQKADIALANQLAQLTAGYRSQLGLAGLGYANQANMQNSALATKQLDFMNSVNAPYPNAGLYAQLAAQRANALRGGGGGGGGMMGAGMIPRGANTMTGGRGGYSGGGGAYGWIDDYGALRAGSSYPRTSGGVQPWDNAGEYGVDNWTVGGQGIGGGGSWADPNAFFQMPPESRNAYLDGGVGGGYDGGYVGGGEGSGWLSNPSQLWNGISGGGGLASGATSAGTGLFGALRAANSYAAPMAMQYAPQDYAGGGWDNDPYALNTTGGSSSYSPAAQPDSYPGGNDYELGNDINSSGYDFQPSYDYSGGGGSWDSWDSGNADTGVGWSGGGDW